MYSERRTLKTGTLLEADAAQSASTRQPRAYDLLHEVLEPGEVSKKESAVCFGQLPEYVHAPDPEKGAKHSAGSRGLRTKPVMRSTGYTT